MERLTAVLALVLIVLGAVGAWYLAGGGQTIHHTSAQVVKAKVLVRLGTMDCYSYSQNMTVSYGNVTIQSHADGGLNNGTYYFHGTRDEMEWWGTIKDHHLVEKVVGSGETKEIETNLTDEELSAMMLYDPVKLALRALGSSEDVQISASWITCNFTLPETEGGAHKTFSGTIKVRFDESYRPLKVVVDGKISYEGKTLRRVSFSADVKNECSTPEWENE
ncbi:hypothetical protein [Thermococcus pacificus]|uniref:Uncharacterized protein n=1 Tax=Thermococcus pacificus TaxID=71998 RepID=A0A218P7F4_9EURY|nr:hypothetical protein [Thermococcus pacificus]ASJ06713.1 hypothetical protein A3L08_04965 [Thermococcus pacificus]